MNRNILEGKWKQLRGTIREKWANSQMMSWIKLPATVKGWSVSFRKNTAIPKWKPNASSMNSLKMRKSLTLQIKSKLRRLKSFSMGERLLPHGITKGENHEYHFDHSLGAPTVGCPASVALQPKLGIRMAAAGCSGCFCLYSSWVPYLIGSKVEG